MSRPIADWTGAKPPNHHRRLPFPAHHDVLCSLSLPGYRMRALSVDDELYISLSRTCGVRWEDVHLASHEASRAA
jgi:hypothetical protein